MMKKALVLSFILLPQLAFASLPGRFLPISENIFRSAQPQAENFASLRDEAKIRTIVSVNNDQNEIDREARNAAAVGIRFISIPMSGFWAPSDEKVNRILAELNNRDNWPVLLHCQHGRDRTGLINGLYRVETEKWEARRAFKEMLNLGFRRALVPLEAYFRSRTGFKGMQPAGAKNARIKASIARN
ncbi:MAG: hypothetical protein EOP11_07810 [Proteobacteria bacterium]|nr:MAG: hypothetical protein EOP11_07810 [Pseudomonadota bacterium]